MAAIAKARWGRASRSASKSATQRCTKSIAADAQPWVFNLATQENCWRSRATYANIETVMAAMRQLASDEVVESIAIPRIGAGYGGLSWNKCRAIIEAIFAEWDGTPYLNNEFVAEA